MKIWTIRSNSFATVELPVALNLFKRNKGIGQLVTASKHMKLKVNELSAASRKRVTRQIIDQLRYLRCWYSDALSAANAAEFDGDAAATAKWDAEAKSLREEYTQLERSIA